MMNTKKRIQKFRTLCARTFRVRASNSEYSDVLINTTKIVGVVW